MTKRTKESLILPNQSVKQFSIDLSSERSIEKGEEPDGGANKRLQTNHNQNTAETTSKRTNLREQIRALREKKEPVIRRERAEDVEENQILQNEHLLIKEVETERRRENVDEITPVIEPSETESEEDSANDVGRNEHENERHRHRKRGRPVGSKHKTVGRKRRSGAQYTDDDVLKVAKA